MSVMTLEGIVEHGQIRLTTHVQLPDNIKVYIVVPDVQIERSARVFSPRLVHPEQAIDFQMEMIEEGPDAGV